MKRLRGALEKFVSAILSAPQDVQTYISAADLSRLMWALDTLQRSSSTMPGQTMHGLSLQGL